MANETTTFASGVAANLKLNVGDMINTISPMDTVFTNLIDKTTAEGVKHEWLEDTDRAPGQNSKPEEWDGTIGAVDQPTRSFNYTNIFASSFGVTDTMEAAAKYGRTSEIERLIKKHLRLVGKDIEYALLNNTTAAAHASGVGGTLKGMKGWITTNKYDFGGTGAASNDLTETIFADGLQKCFEQGGDPQTVLAPPTVARNISTFNGNNRIQLNVDAKDKTIVNAVEYYQSPFGMVQVHITRWLEPDDASGTKYDYLAILDKDRWSAAWLKKVKVERQARRGLVTPVIISGELTLECRNEKANHLISKISRV